jgi:thymidylate synthase
LENDCNIWTGDAYKRFSQIRKSMLMLKPPASEDKLREYIEWYEQVTTQEEFINRIKTDDEFAKKFGNLGPVYGKQWRKWTKKKMYLSTDGSYENIYDEADQTVIDQISILINDLKTNPDSRRLMVNAYNVGELDQMTLPPCHYGFQVYTRELSLEERTEYKKKRDGIARTFAPYTHQMLDGSNIPTRTISLMWSQRSCDFPLGIPANIMSYGILLMMLAKQVNMIPDELIGNFGDCHIYLNQIDGVKEQLTREPYPLPIVKLSDRVVNDISEYTHNDIILENYQSHPKIYFPLSN